MDLVGIAASLLAPPLCAACGRGCRIDAVLCTRCSRSLAAMTPVLAGGPQGIDRVWSSASHEDVARALVAALKFRRLLAAAELMADRMHWLVPGLLLGGAVVSVPAAPARMRRRGFDPAGELAAALAARLGIEPVVCLARRGSGHQVGKRRSERVRHPPRIESIAESPPSVLLVDDVLTTGATLTACAAALRAGGAKRIVAVTFTRRL